jgi:hypothetical protein
MVGLYLNHFTFRKFDLTLSDVLQLSKSLSHPNDRWSASSEVNLTNPEPVRTSCVTEELLQSVATHCKNGTYLESRSKFVLSKGGGGFYCILYMYLCIIFFWVYNKSLGYVWILLLAPPFANSMLVCSRLTHVEVAIMWLSFLKKKDRSEFGDYSYIM